MIETIFTVPIPPSVNALWFNRSKGRSRTPAYNAWRDQAGWEIRRQRPKSFVGPVMLAYEISDKARMDLGNAEKPLTDLLVQHQIIMGDDKKTVRGISLAWCDVTRGVRVTIRPAVERPF